MTGAEAAGGDGAARRSEEAAHAQRVTTLQVNEPDMSKKLLTESVLAQIRHWIEVEHLGLAEIAGKVGCTVGTLRVRCSQHGVSLRRSLGAQRQSRGLSARGGTRKALRPHAKLSFALPIDTFTRLKERAGRSGISASTLVQHLIEIIDRDNLYSAVMDDSTLSRQITRPTKTREGMQE